LTSIPSCPPWYIHIFQAGSKARQTAARENALEFLNLINQFAEIFWATKGIATKRAKAPYKPGEEVVYPVYKGHDALYKTTHPLPLEFGLFTQGRKTPSPTPAPGRGSFLFSGFFAQMAKKPQINLSPPRFWGRGPGAGAFWDFFKKAKFQEFFFDFCGWQSQPQKSKIKKCCA